MARKDPVLAGKGQTDYERYIRTEDLLVLQRDPTGLSTHDEAMFQMVHQQAEIWMKLVLFELHEVAGRIGRDDLLGAVQLLQRMHRIMGVLTDGIHVLETMAPWDYHKVRLALGRGSGQDSPGFNRLLVSSPALWPPFEGALSRRGVDLLSLYHGFPANADLHALSEALADYDEGFQLWRQHHLLLVKRIIGDQVASLQGTPVENLEFQVKGRFFPPLWDVRNRLTAHANTTLRSGAPPTY